MQEHEARKGKGRRNGLFVALVFVLIAAGPALAVTGSAVWLEQGGGGRWLGMGGAARAASRDVYSGYWNPAGLTQMGSAQYQVGTMLELQTMDRATMSLSGAMQTDNMGNYGVTFIRHTIAGIEKVDELGNVLGEETSAGNAVLLSGGWSPLYQVRVGVTAKLLNESLLGFNAVGGGADIGMMVQPLLAENLWLALTVHNVASSMSWDGSTSDTLARAIAGGVAWRVFSERYLLTADVVSREGQGSAEFHGGAEVYIVPEAALQAGVNDMRPCVGASFNWRIYELDYAFTYDREELGTHHQVNFLLSF